MPEYGGGRGPLNMYSRRDLVYFSKYKHLSFYFSKISNSARNGAKCTQVWIKTEIKSGAAKEICSSGAK